MILVDNDVEERAMSQGELMSHTIRL